MCACVDACVHVYVCGCTQTYMYVFLSMHVSMYQTIMLSPSISAFILSQSALQCSFLLANFLSPKTSQYLEECSSDLLFQPLTGRKFSVTCTLHLTQTSSIGNIEFGRLFGHMQSTATLQMSHLTAQSISSFSQASRKYRCSLRAIANTFLRLSLPTSANMLVSLS